MLDVEMLTEERRRFFLETHGGVYFPIAGAIFWLLLGGLGFYMSERTWCVVVLSAGVVATPSGIILFKKLVSHGTQVAAGHLDFAGVVAGCVVVGHGGAAFYSDLSLVPLALVIDLASHWPAVGWLFDTSIFTVRAIVRVLLAVAIWFLLPQSRFTLLPISIGVVYAVTSFWILREVRRG